MRDWRSLAIAAAVLAGCDDPAAPAGRAAAPAAPLEGRAAEAARAAEERLRARLRIEGAPMLRAVQVHRQALAETLAVCGQVNPTGRGEDAFIPYVAVVGFEGERVARVEFHLAASSPEATRVYFEMVDRCFDGGGPQGARTTGRPLPPAPSGLPRSVEEPVPVAAPPAMPPAAVPPTSPAPVAAPRIPAGPPQGSVTTTMRTPANVRATPGGGGAVVRVVPRGSTLQVFDEAPGGWLLVGEGEPWGWLHSSLLEGR